MPIKIKNGLPVRAQLDHEHIFVMDEDRAIHQHIRPIEIAILNLMPLKEDTELQLLRALSNTPLQIHVTFLTVATHESKNVERSHLDTFYRRFPEVKNRHYDGLIITGAPVEQLPFEEVDYWEELREIFAWSDSNVTSTIYLCWAAQAALYCFYGIKKRPMEKKLVGIYEHQVFHKRIPLVRGFDDVFLAPHSRYTEVPLEEIEKHPLILLLASSEKAGAFLCMSENGRKIFVFGHPEYDRLTLRAEYIRDMGRGLNPDIPENYFPDDDPEKEPPLTWRSHANDLYTNWLNYYVYQTTPYALEGTPGAGNDMKPDEISTTK